jgi:SNF2 family DNA or RNA helicase
MELIHERLLNVASVQSIFDYNGEMTSAARSECIQKLEAAVNKNAAAKDIRHTVLLVQIHCGGTGLNLQFMDRVIFTTPWWTAALMDQAAGRVLRIGQKKQVVIHTISLKEEEQTSLNIDEFIQQRVDIKREICKSMIDAADKSITVKEVYAMKAFKKEQELILADEQRGVPNIVA